MPVQFYVYTALPDSPFFVTRLRSFEFLAKLGRGNFFDMKLKTFACCCIRPKRSGVSGGESCKPPRDIRSCDEVLLRWKYQVQKYGLRRMTLQMQTVTIEPQKIRRVKKLDQVGRNLNFDRQASEVLFEVHNTFWKCTTHSRRKPDVNDLNYFPICGQLETASNW